MTTDPMLFEVKVTNATTGTLTTNCPVYAIEAGHLYLIHVPYETTQQQVDAIRRAAFAPGSQVLDPPASFLFLRAGWRFEERTDDDLRATIRQLQAIIDERIGRHA